MQLLIDEFASVVKKYPRRIAINKPEREITYSELNHCIQLVANWLNDQGFVKGDRVGIHLQNTIEYIVLYYACWRACLVPVALNILARQREIENWLDNSGCKIVFSETLKGVNFHIPVAVFG